MKKLFVFLICLTAFTTGLAFSEPVQLMGKDEILRLLAERQLNAEINSLALHEDTIAGIKQAQEGKGLGDLFNMAGIADAITDIDNPFEGLNGPSPSDLGFVFTHRLLGGPAVQSLSFLNSDIRRLSEEEVAPTALTRVLGLFSFVGIGLVSVFLSYTALTGFFQQARDGEFLGRNWDSTFILVRSLTSVVGTYPNPFFGGLSVIQMMVLTTFLIGLGAGSTLLALAAPALMSQPIVAAQFQPEKIKKLSDAIADMQICGMTQLYETDTPLPEGKRWVLEDHSTVFILRYDVEDWRSCGYITASRPVVAEPGESRLSTFIRRLFINDITGNIVTLGGAAMGGVKFEGGFTNDGQITAYIRAHLREAIFRTALPKLFEDIEALTMVAWHAETMAEEHDSILNGDTQGAHSSFQKMAGAMYWQAMDSFEMKANQEVENVINSSQFIKSQNDFFTETVKSQGMLFGGAYYYLISRRQNAIAQALEGALPNVTPINLTLLQNAPWMSNWDGLRRFVLRIGGGNRERMTSSKQVFNQIVAAAPEFTPDYSKSLRSLNKASSGDITPFGRAASKIAEVMTAIPRIGENSSAINPDPILEMQSMGTKIFQGMFVLDALGVSGLDGGDNSESGDGQSDFLKKAINLGLYGLVAVAFLYSTVIPALPFVIYTISILGLFAFLLKALVVANLWWALMAHPEGNDLVGKSGPGYPMLLSLLLRPVLSVVGLVAAIAIIRLSAFVINVTLFPTIELMNDGLTNPIGMANYFVTYGILMLVVTYKNIGLVYELPQSVLQFIGVGSGYTDFGESDAQTKIAGLGLIGSKLVKGGSQ